MVMTDTPSNDNAGVSRHSFSNTRMQEFLSKDSEANEEDGYWDAGVRWLERQRERRQRESLEQQVEEQMRKIQADSEDIFPSRSLWDNATFQQLTNCAPSEVSGSAQGSLASGLKVSNPTITPSGRGLSVSIEIRELEKGIQMSEVLVRIEEELPSVYHSCPCILSMDQMKTIAATALPAGVTFCPWKRVYSLARDGDSFESFLLRVQAANRTLMVIKTKRGAVLGGYAGSPWENQQHSLAASGSFYGSAQACLFSIEERKVNIYKWTGANRYIQLCDTGHKMLAFGGGGEDGSFGLCVEQDFQRGSTGPCDTFGNAPLCDEENFEIVDMEVWTFLAGHF